METASLIIALLILALLSAVWRQLRGANQSRELRSELRALNTQLERERSMAQDIADERDSLRDELSEQADELDRLRSELGDASEKNQELEQDLNRLTEVLDSIERLAKSVEDITG